LLAALPKNPLLGILFKVTGQSPPEAHESIRTKIMETLDRINFKTEVQLVEVKSGRLLIIIAHKKENYVFRN
jgi:hypothetical protein